MFEAYARDFGQLATEPSLPEPIADLLRGRLAGRVWVPETLFQAVHLVVRDLAFSDDPSFFRWVFETNAALFDKPLLRNLMRLLSPTLIVIGAARRWATFHQGSELTAGHVVRSDEGDETVARLRYPQGLFPIIFLEGLEHAFLAAISAARGKGARVKLGKVDLTEAEYRVTWRT
jgi:hypothetical protein